MNDWVNGHIARFLARGGKIRIQSVRRASSKLLNTALLFVIVGLVLNALGLIDALREAENLSSVVPSTVWKEVLAFIGLAFALIELVLGRLVESIETAESMLRMPQGADR